MKWHSALKLTLTVGVVALLSACHLVMYQPVQTIKQVNATTGYRPPNALREATAKGSTLLDNIDIVYGVSGGFVLASVYGRLEPIYAKTEA